MTELIVAAGALCGAILAVAALIKFVGRPLWKGWRRIDAFLEDWNGTPARPGRSAVPSMPERVSGVEDRLTKVETQITPNGGNTARLGDRIVRVERALGTGPDEGK